MINFLRKALRGNREAYNFAARFYHVIDNYRQRALYRFRGIRYFDRLNLDRGKYKSQYGQDRILEILGLLQRGGVFVEIGSNDPVEGSNSHFLEKEYGYTGISIDAIDFSKEFATHRPNTNFINCLIDKYHDYVDFYIVENKVGWENKVSSVDPKILDHGRGFSGEKVRLAAKPLSDICRDLDQIDILMLDVEGHEINVLESFNWGRLKPRVILAENTGYFFPKRDLENFLNNIGYRLIARVGTTDDIYLVN